MNLDGTRPNPGKTRVYLQKSRFTRKIPGRVPTNVCRARRHIAFSQGQCATHGAQRLLKYAHRTMCCRYACLKAAAAKRRARHADGSADDAVAMCSASRPWRCLACTSAIPISSSQRSRATSWLLPTRPYATSRADRSKRTSIHRGFSDTRLFELEAICENCLARSRRRLRSRSSNENRKRRMLRRRLLSMRRIDRPPRRRRKFGRERRISRAMADLAGVRGSR